MIIPLPLARTAAPSIIAEPQPLPAELVRLIDQHGPARLAAAVLVLIAARPLRPRNADAASLPAHLRRDIGLPPAPVRTDYWHHL